MLDRANSVNTDATNSRSTERNEHELQRNGMNKSQINMAGTITNVQSMIYLNKENEYSEKKEEMEMGVKTSQRSEYPSQLRRNCSRNTASQGQ